MNKCKDCGDLIDSSFEICYDCETSTKEEVKIKIEKNNIALNKEKRLKMLTYRLCNLLLIPLAFCLMFGIIGGQGITNLEITIGFGFGQFLFFYYPPKLIMFFANRLMKKKWSWPIGYSYFILPLIVAIWLMYVNFYL